VLFYIGDQVYGDFGNISIRFGFVEYANVFIFQSSSDGGLVVTYVFDGGGRKAIYFADDSKYSEPGNVSTYICSVRADILNYSVCGTIALNDFVVHLGYKPSLEALAV
jgi:hypothetical protein